MAPLYLKGLFDVFCLGREKHSIDSYIFDLVQQYKSKVAPLLIRLPSHFHISVGYSSLYISESNQ